MKQLFKIGYIILGYWSISIGAQTVALSDTNLLAFLRVNYTQTLDGNNQLITSEAAKVKGSFVCKNQQLRNVDGLQYFTGISTLDLSVNNLSTLPDLSKMTQLKQLWASQNLLTELPNVTANTALQELVVYENQLTQLPSLSTLIHLTYLDVVNNQLSTLPELNACTQLVKLFCNNNTLRVLPNIDSLHNLMALDASYNQISTFPNLSFNKALETLNLNDNLLDNIPVVPILPNIKKIWLYDNWLNFTALQKLKVYTNYQNIFLWSPQFSHTLTESLTIAENQILKLHTSADQGLKGLTYSWFKNQSLVAQQDSVFFTLPKVTFADSGAYTCQLSSIDFPGVILLPYACHVEVSPCINPYAFSTSVTDISCEKSGTLLVNPSQNSAYTYTLQGLASHKVLRSQTGDFSGLEETAYTLSIATGTCTPVTYPYQIHIPKEDCHKAFITPNGDGNHDTFFFSEAGSVKIFNKRGDLIKEMSIPAYWDAHADQGLVPQGIYIVNINNGAKNMTLSVVY